jgi:hypothetical protein
MALPVASAGADTYCVNQTGCDAPHDKGNNFQAALTDAKNNPGPDTVKLGAAGVAAAGGYVYDDPAPLHIEGVGGRLVGSGTSIITNNASSPSSLTVLKVLGSTDSTITGVEVGVPGGTGFGNIGIDTSGTVSNVLVNANGPASGQSKGVVVEAGGRIVDTDVILPTDLVTTAVQLVGAGTTVEDSHLEAAVGVSTGLGSGSATVRRIDGVISSLAVFVSSGDLVVEDSLFVTRVGNGFVHQGATVNATADAALRLNHVTLVGSAKTGARGITATANSSKVEISVRNSVLTYYDTMLLRSANAGGSATISTDYSDYHTGTPVENGPGSIVETNHMDVDPGFLSASDHHLRADSPLLDAGDPAGLAAGETPTDAAGAPRIADGDGNCNARRDIGAFEFTPGPRAPRAVAAATLSGQMATFDAAGSCDPDGGDLSFSWTFDDGGGAPGSSLQRSFSTPGLHFGTVTVTDSTGRSATASASVVIPPLPFAGVTIASQRVRASKLRLVKVAVGCPQATAASCAGVLSLAGRTTTFFFAPGTTRKVSLKLSAKTFKKLRKKKQLKFTATAVAHDANGSQHTSTGKITLLKPH